MLILTRRPEQDIVIYAGRHTIVVRVLEFDGRNRVRLGFEADTDVVILRSEIDDGD